MCSQRKRKKEKLEKSLYQETLVTGKTSISYLVLLDLYCRHSGHSFQINSVCVKTSALPQFRDLGSVLKKGYCKVRVGLNTREIKTVSLVLPQKKNIQMTLGQVIQFFQIGFLST